MAINGKDCMCAAQHEGECACGCDWTTTKEARLQARNAELLAACREAIALLENTTINQWDLDAMNAIRSVVAKAEVSDA